MFDDAAERQRKKKFERCTYVESLIVIDVFVTTYYIVTFCDCSSFIKL